MRIKSVIAGMLTVIANQFVISQTAGTIIERPSDAEMVRLLDPNTDGFVSKQTGGYSYGVLTNKQDESANMELPFISLKQLMIEPEADLQIGQSCGGTDFTDNPAYPGKNAFYHVLNPDNSVEANGDEKIIFRMRLAKNNSAQLGFSILIDTDNKFGKSIDPNYTEVNPGFELEIIYGGINKGVQIVHVDGTAMGKILKQYPGNERIQKSLAQHSTCESSKAIFLDVIVDYADIVPNMNGGFARIALATSTSTSTALNGNAVDIAGYSSFNDDNEAFKAVIDNQVKGLDFLLGFALGAEVLTSAVKVNGAATASINWEVASENNLAFYQVEATTDGKSWDVQTTIEPTVQDRTTKLYTAELTNQPAGLVYYRIALVDVDGTKQYTELLTAEFEGAKVNVYPTLTQGEVYINGVESAELIVINAAGFVVTHQHMQHEAKIDLSQVENGMYLVQIISAQAQQTVRVVKF
jgi:hypothetical protein